MKRFSIDPNTMKISPAGNLFVFDGIEYTDVKQGQDFPIDIEQVGFIIIEPTKKPTEEQLESIYNGYVFNQLVPVVSCDSDVNPYFLDRISFVKDLGRSYPYVTNKMLDDMPRVNFPDELIRKVEAKGNEVVIIDRAPWRIEEKEDFDSGQKKLKASCRVGVGVRKVPSGVFA